eukprot:TRINITY_DN25187_c0_g1_i1.p1 TRINITY_DN25187_c0_g1~~TRINITY_DN25187_c0_g1_i1.p1  ORF type:complete len:518 (+),score=110.52 TRINITY_DN25187_c0_g1_i1:77-1555(+)
MQPGENAIATASAADYAATICMPVIGTASTLDTGRVDELAEELIRTVGTGQSQFHEERNNVLLEFEAARVQLHTEYSQKLLQADEELRLVLEERAARRESCGASQNDIVTLNVGGKQYTVKRETLCVCRGSFLAELFSGRWEQALQKDSEGHVFLDIDPSVFDIILSWLRDCKIETPDRPAASPVVPKEDLQHFQAAVDYLGLRPYLSVSGLNPDGWAASCGSSCKPCEEVSEQPKEHDSRGFLKAAGSFFASLRSAPKGTPTAPSPRAGATVAPPVPLQEETQAAARRTIGWSLKSSHPAVRRGDGEHVAVALIPDTSSKATSAVARSTRGYQSGLHYFDVTVLLASECCYIGLVSADWTSTQLPVGRAAESWGVASDGVVYACEQELERLPVGYGDDSHVGFLLELGEPGHRSATVFINGRRFEQVFTDLPETMYPAVSNFHQPARYRLDCEAVVPESADALADPSEPEGTFAASRPALGSSEGARSSID